MDVENRVKSVYKCFKSGRNYQHFQQVSCGECGGAGCGKSALMIVRGQREAAACDACADASRQRMCGLLILKM
jgi:ArsR family metal-binding transcriptional regulator